VSDVYVTEQNFTVVVDDPVFEVVIGNESVDVITVGIQGPEGPGQTTYTHTQSVPSGTWVIQHLLGRHPSVSVVDSAGSVVVGNVTYDSDIRVTVTFSASFSGKAYLN
jgi:hypothetical protein